MFRSRPFPTALVLTVISVIGITQVQAARPTAEEMSLHSRWVNEHFPAQQTIAAVSATPPEAGLLVWTNLGPMHRNMLPDKPLQIGDQKFEHGLYCHGPSRVQVRLPGPAKSFSAVVGILTNPASQGGSVIFSVDVAEKRLFSSAVMHRGETGAPIHVDLLGAREFTISVGCAGDGLASDQAVWGDAEVTLADGNDLFIGDLPLHDPLTAERSVARLPFSFYYGSQHSDRLLPTWKFQESRDTSDPRKATRVYTYTDPKTGLVVANTVVEYADFPTVEWTLSFKNSGTSDTPLLEGILPLDTRFERGEGGEFLLHHFIGSPCQANDYEPLETKLDAKISQRVSTDGGRPTNTHLPFPG